MTAVRDKLVATLEEALRLQQRLVDNVRDEAVPVSDLVAQVTVLERLDDRRDDLIGQLRRTASAGRRPGRTSPPVREVLLETLAHFRWPQNAGFLEEYLLARHQLQLDSRAFAPLRRDERESLGPGTRRSRGLHRPGTETRRVGEPALDHPFRLGPRTPHRGNPADRTPVRPVQDLCPRRAAGIGRS